jgi:hypothetical protein
VSTMPQDQENPQDQPPASPSTGVRSSERSIAPSAWSNASLPRSGATAPSQRAACGYSSHGDVCRADHLVRGNSGSQKLLPGAGTFGEALPCCLLHAASRAWYRARYHACGITHGVSRMGYHAWGIRHGVSGAPTGRPSHGATHARGSRMLLAGEREQQHSFSGARRIDGVGFCQIRHEAI